MKLRTKKGFTLIELMVVIVIIGVLAALAIPKFTNASAKAKWSEVPTVLASYENAQLARVAETGSLGALGVLVFDAPTDSKWFGYTEPALGAYQGVVAGAGANIGGITTNQGVRTDISAASVITHVAVGCDNEAVNRMMGNFLATAVGSGSGS